MLMVLQSEKSVIIILIEEDKQRLVTGPKAKCSRSSCPLMGIQTGGIWDWGWGLFGTRPDSRLSSSISGRRILPLHRENRDT